LFLKLIPPVCLKLATPQFMVEDTQFDNNAMGVWILPLWEIPVSYHELREFGLA